MRVLRVGVPHNGLHLVACAAVVHALCARAIGACQAATPKWSGAAPRTVYVVNHIQLVLHHIRVGIDGLVGIARQLLVGNHIRCPVVVRAGLP